MLFRALVADRPCAEWRSPCDQRRTMQPGIGVQLVQNEGRNVFSRYRPTMEVGEIRQSADGAAAGLVVRAPLARVPENTMKFVVGVMLTSFGVFWGAEGADAHWPGNDAALLIVVPCVALYALALVAVLRRRAPRPAAPASEPMISEGV